MLPNFLIVGAAKSGTTALYYYLEQHPDIYFPKLKEPKYFSSKFLDLPHQGVGDKSVDRYRVEDFNNYQKLFQAKGETMIGEASPEYLYYHNEVARDVKKTLGDIPIIIILRNPAKRAFSAYSYLKRDTRELHDFEKALSLEEERRKQNWDFIWAYKQAGMYYEQVRTFKETFSKVLILTQEGMKKDTLFTIRQAFSFLGVDETVSVDTTINHNPSGTPNNFIARAMLSRSNPISPYIREVAKKLVPRSLLEKVASASMDQTSTENIDFEELFKVFEGDIQKLERYLGTTFDVWRT